MFAVIESFTVTNDPAYPWSLPGVGLPALAAVTLVLIVLTVWTYLGVPGATVRRVLVVLGLRLAALIAACLALLGPSLALRDELRVPSVLLIAVDHSESMTIQDEIGGQSRWDYARGTLEKCEPFLQRLQEAKNVTIVRYRFSSEVGEFDPKGAADGKRTDFGEMLHTLYDRHRGERYLRGLLILSDGADNGARYPALPLASQFRSLPCPVHTFGFGKETTGERQSDIALTDIACEPSPVPIKGKLTVTGYVDAHGFENADVNLHLLIEDKEVATERVFINEADVTREQKKNLPLSTGNKVKLECYAPDAPGEVKVTLKIDPKPGEVTAANNEISTYVTVAKEGLSVLLVDKARMPEPQLICDALRQDPSIRLQAAWLRREEAAAPEQMDLFQFGKQHYDVIIIGDVTARQLSGGNKQVLETIKKLVSERGTGLLMLGGYATFGNSDWQGTPIADLLPVRLDVSGQEDRDVKIRPTATGLIHYILLLADNPDANKDVWDKLPELNGMTKLGERKTGAFELATSDRGSVLVGQQFGTGRVLAFAGDTTYLWRTTPEGVARHNRFWKQVVLWLARQEERKGSVVVKPETRRLPAGSKLPFTVGLRGKGGVEAKEAHFDVKVVSPKEVETPVPTAREKTDERGTFWKTDLPGEYRLVVRGWGRDVDGQDIPAETATVRFLVSQDNAEMARRGADHEFLRKLASTGGGRFHRADELAQFLQDLQTQPLPQGGPKAELWPDWRRNSLSGFLVGFFLVFVALLSLEWILRRRWGLV